MPTEVIDPNNPVSIFQAWLGTQDDLNRARTLNELWDHYSPPNQIGSIPYDPEGVQRLVALLQEVYPGEGMDSRKVAQWQDLSQAMAELE